MKKENEITKRQPAGVNNKKYEREVQEYEEKSKIRKEYLDKITKEEQKALEEQNAAKKLAFTWK